VTVTEMARRIQFWPLDRLVPYARNARTHSPAQIAKIAKSIHEFGFTNPILVDGDSGIIAGHARLAAARQLGLAQVPVIELTHLSEDQKRAYILADNRLALEAGWDAEILAGELGELKAVDFDINLTGFDEKELVMFLSRTAGSDSPEQSKDRATVRIRCRSADAEAIATYLKTSLRKRGFRRFEVEFGG